MRRHAIIAAALAVFCAAASASTDWSRPGEAPFMGDVVAAVDAYTDIPLEARRKLQAKMAARRYDDLVAITRDGIYGSAIYWPTIWDMHWQDGLRRGPVNRSGWPASAVERGLVYCEDEHCILVPTICRNVSRISRVSPRHIEPDARSLPDSWAGPTYLDAVLSMSEIIAPAPAVNSDPLPTILPLPRVAFGPATIVYGPAPSITFGVAVIAVPPVPPIPEPASLLLAALGVPLVVIAARRRR